MLNQILTLHLVLKLLNNNLDKEASNEVQRSKTKIN
jgi:hypothetical protein